MQCAMQDDKAALLVGGRAKDVKLSEVAKPRAQPEERKDRTAHGTPAKAEANSNSNMHGPNVELMRLSSYFSFSFSFFFGPL